MEGGGNISLKYLYSGIKFSNFAIAFSRGRAIIGPDKYLSRVSVRSWPPSSLNGCNYGGPCHALKGSAWRVNIQSGLTTHKTYYYGEFDPGSG